MEIKAFTIWSFTICSFICALGASAQSVQNDIAPAHFGPNAFPVPDMLDGRVSEQLKVELAGDYYRGFDGNQTADLFARVYIPLFTKRVNLTLWMPIQEWYWQNDTTGHGTGDVYVSTDIQVLKAKKWWPDITIRAALKTASGEQYERRRHFDDPGYWFDLSVGKSLTYKDWEFRLAASTGFLCWQTTTAAQNDAVQYGAQLLINYTYCSLRATYSGYSGWQKNGDCPMIIKGELRGHIKGFEPFAVYQYGIQDYPFHQVRVGLAYNIDIIKPKKP